MFLTLVLLAVLVVGTGLWLRQYLRGSAQLNPAPTGFIGVGLKQKQSQQGESTQILKACLCFITVCSVLQSTCKICNGTRHKKCIRI